MKSLAQLWSPQSMSSKCFPASCHLIYIYSHCYYCNCNDSLLIENIYLRISMIHLYFNKSPIVVTSPYFILHFLAHWQSDSNEPNQSYISGLTLDFSGVDPPQSAQIVQKWDWSWSQSRPLLFSPLNSGQKVQSKYGSGTGSGIDPHHMSSGET